MGAAAGAIAGAGAIGGIYAGNKAASAQRQAAAGASRELRASKNEAYGFLNPWSNAGGSALSPLTGLLTGSSYNYQNGQQTQLDPSQRMSLFQQSPGYQFRLDEAMKAIQGSQAARGNLLSGGAMKELTQYSQGIASEEYNNQIDQLFKLAGMGQQSDTSKANAAIGVGSDLAQSAYSGGMGNVNKYNNISNASFGMMGMGAKSMGGGAGGAGGGFGGS
jgi:hypothetical protein